ncbi:PilZ domain-containing protein [bacterium]|nr:PilZ domain-containing protein [bacterium]
MNESSYNAETIAERRKFVRYQLALKVHYFKSVEQSFSAEKSQSISRDLGIGGVAILLEESLKPGQTLKVEIALPNVEDIFSGDQDSLAMSASEKNIALLSEVVWCRQEKDKRYLVGVRFLDLEKEDAKALKFFLEEYSLRDHTQSGS